jgi:hypothetical protein
LIELEARLLSSHTGRSGAPGGRISRKSHNRSWARKKRANAPGEPIVAPRTIRQVDGYINPKKADAYLKIAFAWPQLSVLHRCQCHQEQKPYGSIGRFANPASTQELLASFIHDAGQATAMTISLRPGHIPETFTQVIA